MPDDYHPFFNYYWGLICKVNSREPHCLTRGCGRNTLASWVRDVCGVRVSPNMLRRTLLIAVERGMATISISSCGYTCFHLMLP